MLSVRPLAGGFGDCSSGDGCVGWFAWLGGVEFAAAICAPLSPPLLAPAPLACPAALLAVELLGRLAPFVPPVPFALLMPLVPFAPLGPFVSLVPVVLFVSSPLLLFVPFVL